MAPLSSRAVALRAALLALALALAARLAAAAAPPRNILFMVEDDGSMDLGVYGNRVIPTPNIDALAARGTAFDRFHTTVSSCSPSRAALMTGLPSHQNGMYGLEHGVEHFASFSGAKSWPNVLNAAGYVTGIIGKYHVAPVASFNFTWGNDPSGPGGCQAGASDIACPDVDYNTVARNITNMRNQAARFLDYAAAQAAPWALYVGFGDMHRCGGPVVGEFCELYGIDAATGRSTIPDWVPFSISPADVALPFWIQDTPIARSDLAKSYTSKNRMDQGVGLMLALLEQRGLANSTLIIYTADNGAPFAAGKTNQYEVATMEPMVAVMPGAARVGVRSVELASTLDLFPTMLAWAGLPLPKGASLPGGKVSYTGRSLLPLIGAADATPAFPAPRHRLLMGRAEAAAAGAAVVVAREGAAVPALGANATRIHGSFQHHEVQEYYPMRSVVAADPATNASYRLIYNIASRLLYPSEATTTEPLTSRAAGGCRMRLRAYMYCAPMPGAARRATTLTQLALMYALSPRPPLRTTVASDLWAAPAMQDLINRTRSGQDTHW